MKASFGGILASYAFESMSAELSKGWSTPPGIIPRSVFIKCKTIQ